MSEPAFPCQFELISSQRGMLLRDYFAAKAMQGIFSCPTCVKWQHGGTSDEIAQNAYAMADSMLKARE